MIVFIYVYLLFSVFGFLFGKFALLFKAAETIITYGF